jgi:hypothetical protein
MQGIGCQQALSYCTVATEGVAGGAQGTIPLIAIACLRGIHIWEMGMIILILSRTYTNDMSHKLCIGQSPSRWQAQLHYSHDSLLIKLDQTGMSCRS